MFGDPAVMFRAMGLDRAAHLRADAAALHARADARCLPMWQGRPLADGAALAFLPLDHPALAGQNDFCFLGLRGDQALFCCPVPDWQTEVADRQTPAPFVDNSAHPHPMIDPALGFVELRSVLARLSPEDGEIAATAKALLAWHETHRFCAKCGAPSHMVQAGWQRACGVCQAQHFPRTDPVVIMLITHGNNVLLGRSPGWPAGMYSLLAGFMEPGETIETAVRREVFEEAGVRVGAVRYLASQPWPFPASLMIGCAGEAISTDIAHDPVEIEHVLWLTREELADVFAGQNPNISAPRSGSIAAFLMREWLADRVHKRQ